MKKTMYDMEIIILAIILLLVELSSGKPMNYSENSDSHDVIKKPIHSLDNRDSDATALDHKTDSNIQESIDTTVFHEDEKITGLDIHADKSSQLIPSQPISGVTEIASLHKSEFEKSTRLPITFQSVANSENPNSFLTDSKFDSITWTAGNSITTLEPVANSLVTSLELVSGATDNLLTTFEPGASSFNSSVNFTSEKSDLTLPTTLEYDSGRRGDLTTTFTPEILPHDNANKLSNQPAVTSEHKNRAYNIRSSCTMIYLGILFIAGSKVA